MSKKIKGTAASKSYDFISNKLAPVFAKLADNKYLSSITQGFMGSISATLMGSFFLLLLVLSTYVPALHFWDAWVIMGFNLTLGLISIYIAASIAIAFAKNFKLDPVTAVVINLGSFFLLTANIDLATGALHNLSDYDGGGIFPALLCSLVTMSIYKFCVEKKIIIKMPDGVPPAIAAMFTGLIPGFISFILAWFIHNVLGIELIALMSTLLEPIFNAADNIVTFTFRFFLVGLLWAIGMHGDSMVGTIEAPFITTWMADNMAAAASGVAGTALPHIWTTGLVRMAGFTASLWGLQFWMLKSKAKSLRSLGTASIGPSIFCIIEPIVFGLPVVFNPYLFIPWVLSHTLSGFVSYGVMALGWVSKISIDLPWVTPAPIIGFVGTGGDWRGVLLVVVNFLIGVAVYAPFFKIFEKSELDKEKTEQAA